MLDVGDRFGAALADGSANLFGQFRPLGVAYGNLDGVAFEADHAYWIHWRAGVFYME